MDRLSPFDQRIRGDVLGVIDLKQGLAVHAVAGRRDHYRPVRLPSNHQDGDPIALVHHYIRQGVEQFYVADLDALTAGPLQARVLEALLNAMPEVDRIMIDVGLALPLLRQRTGVASLKRLLQQHRGVRLLAATEALANAFELNQVTRHLDARRLAISLDYRNGGFIQGGRRVDGKVMTDWLQQCRQLKIREAIILDLADVGRAEGVTTAGRCHEIAGEGVFSWIGSGGGIRNTADVEALKHAGCDGCLVGTALLPDQSD